MNVQGRRKGETAREYAYRMIREQIISLGLKPGEAFNDMEFAAKIGVSRTPVREAVIQLSEESRIIEIFPQRGMRIALIDVQLAKNRPQRQVQERLREDIVKQKRTLGFFMNPWSSFYRLCFFTAPLFKIIRKFLTEFSFI